jgi:hypothetical protein
MAIMPLHALISIHCDAGLRKRLLLEIPDFPPARHARAEGALLAANYTRPSPG